jgi:hypothetical protein
MSNKSFHPTKKGPGRKHGQGHTHGFVPRAHYGADSSFVLHSNPLRNTLRKGIAAMGGIRQFKIQRRAIQRLEAAQVL